MYRVRLVGATALFASTSMLAQSGAGSIQGTVQDSTGAALPRAAIHVVNQETGRSVDVTANDKGYFSVPSLFTGNYTVSFAAAGMKKLEQSLSLQVGQNAVLNPALTPGAVTEQITVTEDVVQLATYDSPAISSTLENDRINQLPINGRNLTTLTGLTTPGLEGTRANGLLGQALEFVQDGAPLSNRNIGGATRLPDPDAVQEVRVETANSSAQFATPATAIITTKSGTNAFHGSAFETARNNYIGTAKARQDPSNLAAPHLVRNEFGASIGGPILIPHLYDGRNRSFFFVAFERLSLRQNVSSLTFVPTVAMRNGDFSGLVNSSSQLQTLYDNQTSNPTTYLRTAFVNNQIPLSRLSPVAQKLYAVTPLPTNASNPLVASNFTAAAITNQTAPTTTFRLDQNFSEKNKAYLRFTSTQYTAAGLQSATNAPTVAGGGFGAGFAGITLSPTTVYSAALGYNHIFSSSFYSETIFGNTWEDDVVKGGSDPNIDYRAMLGLPENFGNNSFQVGANLFTNYVVNRVSYSGSQIVTNLDENLTKILGRHQMLFGGRYRHERLGVIPDQTVATTAFNGMATGQLDPSTGANYGQLANTGNVNADFFLGAASSYGDTLTGRYLHYHDFEIDSYFQDNFHVNSKLTINAGVRWEVHPAAVELGGQNNGFDIKNKAIVLYDTIPNLIAKGATTQAIITNLQNLGTVFETAQQAGFPNAGVYNSDFTFSPRLGAAFAPFGDHGTVFRGGYGRYIYPIPLRNYYASQASNAPYSFTYTQSYTAANQSPDGLPNYLLRRPQPVTAGLNSAGVVNTGGTNSILPGLSQVFLNPHFPPNYVQQANATVEQPIAFNSVLRITYLYNHGSNLDQFYQINAAPSAYVYDTTTGHVAPTGTYSAVATLPYDQTLYGTNLIEDNRNGWSNDNALQVNLQRLFKNGFAFQGYYVWSKSFRVGGNTFRDSTIQPVASFAPGALPPGTSGLPPYGINRALNRFENYQIDSATPRHHVRFNGIVDLPLGRGKRFLPHVNRFVDELIGGYQIAGDGNIVSQYLQPLTTNFGQTAPTQVYKHAHPVTDCRSGVCHPAYQWFNGYINPLVLNNPCGPSLLTGNFAGYQPYQTPINTNPGTVTCKGSVAVASNAQYLTNNVPVPLSNGTSPNVAYSPGPALNPFAHTFLAGPINYTVDVSVFKVFPITERVNLRLNIDAFNALNVQGYVNPNSTDGIESLQTSANTPRQVQFTIRLTY